MKINILSTRRSGQQLQKGTDKKKMAKRYRQPVIKTNILKSRGITHKAKQQGIPIVQRAGKSLNTWGVSLKSIPFNR